MDPGLSDDCSMRPLSRPTVVIDARWEDYSGIGTYIQNMIPGLVRSTTVLDFLIIVKFNSQLKKVINLKNVYFLETQGRMYSIYENLKLWIKIPKTAVLYFASHYAHPFLGHSNVIVMLHDVLHLRPTVCYLSWYKRVFGWVYITHVLRNSKMVLTNSNFSKSEINLLFEKYSNKVVSIHLGVAPHWFVNGKRSRGSEKFVVVHGNQKPHKNIISLVRAFSLIKHHIRHKLVIVGSAVGGQSPELRKELEDSAIRDRVEFTGFLSSSELVELVAEADCFVFPSLYEGFGLPPLEAMAAGCPVAVSDIPAVREVCGDSAVYFNPLNELDIAFSILSIVTNKALQDRLSLAGIERARKFTWDKTIEKTLKLLSIYT